MHKNDGKEEDVESTEILQAVRSKKKSGHSSSPPSPPLPLSSQFHLVVMTRRTT